MTGDEAIVFLEAIKRGLHQTGKDHPYRDDLIPKMKEALCIAIEEMKAEPCEDAISREELLKNQTVIVDDDGLMHKVVHIGRICAAPSVNPRLRTGKWIKHDTGHSIYYDCSLCGCTAPHIEVADKILWKLSNYCPDCGAEMEGIE